MVAGKTQVWISRQENRPREVLKFTAVYGVVSKRYFNHLKKQYYCLYLEYCSLSFLGVIQAKLMGY